MIHRLGLFGAITLVLALVYAIAWGTESGAGTGASNANAAPRTTDVTSVTRSCPPPAPNTGKVSIAVAAASAGSGSAGSGSGSAGSGSRAGSAVLAAVPSAATAKAGAATAKAPAEPMTAATPNTAFFGLAPQAAQSGATQIDATGVMATGFEAEEATASGMGTVICAHPGADMWFVGTGQDAGASEIWLDLTNTGVTPATADIAILTDSGAQDALGDGVTVPAHRFVSVNLAQYVKGSSALAVQVQTSSGQVTANIWEDGGDGGAWLPAAAAPSTRLVIPGLPAGSAAKLFVAVPGADDAQVKVEELTSRGKFLPFGAEAQDAPAAAASAFPLNSAGVSAAALVLTSNVPITAGVLVTGAGIGGFTAAAAPVTEQGVVAGNPSGGGDVVGLVLSAPAAAARVTVETLPADTERSPAPPQHRLYTVQAARTLAVTVSPPKGDHGPFAIVVTPQPGSGPLYAARVVVSGGSGLAGQLRSLLPVPNAPLTVRLPPVTNSYSAVLP